METRTVGLGLSGKEKFDTAAHALYPSVIEWDRTNSIAIIWKKQMCFRPEVVIRADRICFPYPCS